MERSPYFAKAGYTPSGKQHPIPFMTSPPRQSPLLLAAAVLAIALPIAAPAQAPAPTRTAAQQSAPFRITGAVVNAATRAPIPHCRLVAVSESTTSAPQPPPNRRPPNRRRPLLDPNTPSAETDAAGRFLLDLPSAGRWNLSAAARGFRRQSLDEHEGFSSAVVLTPAAPSLDLLFHLEPDAVITGTILDEAAEPVRDATVALIAATSLNPDVSAAAPGALRQTATTDDRGHYELAAIPPGSYRLSVQARPWYAAAGQFSRGIVLTSTAPAASSNPVLDVIYPTTWYPGALESESGSLLTLHAGETRQADLSLLPTPAAHLRAVPLPASPGQPVTHAAPRIERLGAQSSPFNGSSYARLGPDNALVFDGLEPGLYRVTTSEPNGESHSIFVQVQPGSTTALTAAGSLPTAEVTLHLTGEDSAGRSAVTLTDIATGIVYRSFRGGPVPSLRYRPQLSSSKDPAASPTADPTLQVPAGRYQVTLSSPGDLYLASLSAARTAPPSAAQPATQSRPQPSTQFSRIINLPAGPVTLTLGIARGRATVTGFVADGGKPLPGAMVLLVPASFGQPGSLDLLRRDQSNTDGSFDLAAILPGDYILVAIRDGWSLNWHDPPTLARLLLQGLPLSLTPGSHTKQYLAAQSP